MSNLPTYGRLPSAVVQVMFLTQRRRRQGRHVRRAELVDLSGLKPSRAAPFVSVPSVLPRTPRAPSDANSPPTLPGLTVRASPWPRAPRRSADAALRRHSPRPRPQARARHRLRRSRAAGRSAPPSVPPPRATPPPPPRTAGPRGTRTRPGARRRPTSARSTRSRRGRSGPRPRDRPPSSGASLRASSALTWTMVNPSMFEKSVGAVPIAPIPDWE